MPEEARRWRHAWTVPDGFDWDRTAWVESVLMPAALIVAANLPAFIAPGAPGHRPIFDAVMGVAFKPEAGGPAFWIPGDPRACASGELETDHPIYSRTVAALLLVLGSATDGAIRVDIDGGSEYLAAVRGFAWGVTGLKL